MWANTHPKIFIIPEITRIFKCKSIVKRHLTHSGVSMMPLYSCNNNDLSDCVGQHSHSGHEDSKVYFPKIFHIEV